MLQQTSVCACGIVTQGTSLAHNWGKTLIQVTTWTILGSLAWSEKCVMKAPMSHEFIYKKNIEKENADSQKID